MTLLLGEIGSYEMLEMTGGVGLMGQEAEEITRPGVDGVAYKLTGQRPREFTIQTKAGVNSDSALINLRANYMALKGTLVEVVEPGFTASHTNVFVRDVVTDQPVRVTSATNNEKWILPATWTLVYTELLGT